VALRPAAGETGDTNLHSGNSLAFSGYNPRETSTGDSARSGIAFLRDQPVDSPGHSA
jgi:hypothetical protein